jgi:hypothetical protein
MQPAHQDTETRKAGNLDELSRLLVPGAIGFYDFVEVTEVVAFVDGTTTPNNVFTIIVAGESDDEAAIEPQFLNPRRIELANLNGWKFGVLHYRRLISELELLISDITSLQVWRGSGKDLKLGPMTALSSKFVPPDGLTDIPLNRVLKNNFWSGSHVLEWVDPKKEQLRPFFEDPTRLQDLSDQLNPVVPIRVGALSDRLGNIVLQLPVTVVAAKFSEARISHALTLKIGWHPKATPRELMVTCERNSDGFISAFAAVKVTGEETPIPLASREGHYRASIWEPNGGTLLAATGEFDFFDAVPINMHVLTNSTRTFLLRDTLGVETKHEVGVITHQNLLVGIPYVDPNGGFTQSRLYAEEISRLLEQRQFVQYAKELADPQVERRRALADIRRLINDHSEAGAWLWDPFLTARDILDTLFFCHRRNADLRALTSGKEAPGDRLNDTPAEDFVVQQKRLFQEAQSNLEGLRLEFRRKFGQYGSPFHDRFLIFPRTLNRETLVWSLGQRCGQRAPHSAAGRQRTGHHGCLP